MPLRDPNLGLPMDLTIDTCTTCGDLIQLESTLRGGQMRVHEDGEFLCPEPSKPDLSFPKKRLK